MKKVIVVGAGFAGLSAATALQSAPGEVEVVVLEGGDRVGGRANTRRLEGIGNSEFGATYLHGLGGHIVYAAAKDAGLIGPVHTKELVWGFVTPAAAKPLAAELSAPYQASIRAYAEARDSDEYLGTTLGQKLAKAAEQKQGELTAKERDDFLKAWRWHEVQLMLNSSSPSSADVSSEWWEVCDDLEGPNFPIPAGFQSVAEWMAKGLDIRFNSVVAAIERSSTGVRVKTQAGEEFAADAVIVTVSLGVLKETHRSMFQPPLPQAKADAIEKLGWGYNEKIFVEFEGAQCSDLPVDEAPTVAYNLLWDIPWPGPGRAEILGSKTDSSGVPAWAPGIFSFRFGGSEFKPATVPTASLHAVRDEREKYTLQPGRFFGNSSIEMAHLAAFAMPNAAEVLPAAKGHPRVACLWVSGWHAKALAAAPEEEVREGVGAVLERFPAIPFSRGDISRVWRSTWTQDPLFRGAYSYVAAAASPADNEALAQPVTDATGLPVICFAGEATTATNTASTHGACLTGRREALRLLAAWG